MLAVKLKNFCRNIPHMYMMKLQDSGTKDNNLNQIELSISYIKRIIQKCGPSLCPRS